MTTNGLPLLTASRQACARRCRREHFFSYVQGYRPAREADTLRFGSLIHLALEAWWKAAQAGAPDEERLQIALNAMVGEADSFDRARAEAMMVGYDLRWAAELVLYEVLAVEAPFKAALINPDSGAPSRTWQLGGKLDVILRERATGRIIICDHKSLSSDIRPGSDVYRRLRLDGQVSTYYVGAAALGYQAEAWMHDVLAKPAQRPLKKVTEVKLKRDGQPYANQRLSDETPEEYRARIMEAIAEDPSGYFQRVEAVRLEQELIDAAFDVWQLGVNLKDELRAGRHNRNPDACIRFGSTCPYFPVCVHEASLDDPTLYRRITDMNPELGQVAT